MTDIKYFFHKRSELQIRKALRTCTIVLALGCGAMGLGGCAGGANGGPDTQGSDAQNAHDMLMSSGVEAESNRNYDTASQSFYALMERDPTNTKVMTALLRNLRYSGRPDEAVRIAEQRGQDLLGDPFVKFEYGKALLASGRETQALAQIKEAVQMMPQDWKVHSALGIAYDAMGRYDQAISAYMTALGISPENAVVLNNLAMSQAMSGRLQAAIGTLETAAGYNRSNTQIRQNLALLYAANGEVEKARALAAMDLESGDLENNLSFYSRFGRRLP